MKSPLLRRPDGLSRCRAPDWTAFALAIAGREEHGERSCGGMSAPWGGLVAELREVIVTARPRADVELIERACEVAAWCHQGQLRYSGDPYITHPVAVATILARLGDAGEVDDQTLYAAMVAGHMALDRLGRRPGRQVAQVMTTILSADARVVATKLADRLHNMQTLQVLPRPKQLRKPGKSSILSCRSPSSSACPRSGQSCRRSRSRR
jgi:hypothetical protein